MGTMLGVTSPSIVRFQQLHSDRDDGARQELAEGLLDKTPQISPKFFYDALGSTLFDAITRTDEYYPTRTEARIFKRHAAEFARHIGPVHAMIDLGAADCRKAESLFATLRPALYVPVDISVEYLRAAVARIEGRHPDLPILALGMDFSDRFILPAEVPAANRLFFYPGSSIGNLSPDEALALLRGIRQACTPDGAVLIGVDRVKAADVLEAAYDDALGITAAFNLNALRHANHILGGDFDVAQWRHVALYDAARHRVEMHLEARCEVTVTWDQTRRQFDAGERIHTECSYKYTPEMFESLLTRAGFQHIIHRSDEDELFSVFCARA